MQVGLESASRIGAHTSTWLSLAWSCYVLNGGPMRLEVFQQVMPQATLGCLCLQKSSSEIYPLSLTGLINEVELGAQSVVYQLANVAYMVSPFNVKKPCQKTLFIKNFLILHPCNNFFLFLVPFGFQHSGQCKSWKCFGRWRNGAGQAVC